MWAAGRNQNSALANAARVLYRGNMPDWPAETITEQMSRYRELTGQETGAPNEDLMDAVTLDTFREELPGALRG